MAVMIKGETITLYSKVQTGIDPFNKPIYEEIPIEVDNVIIAPATDQEIIDSINLYGKKAVYTLGIPKGDTNNWLDARVTFFDKDWRTFGFVEEGIEAMVPLDWHHKIKVARYG